MKKNLLSYFTILSASLLIVGCSLEDNIDDFDYRQQFIKDSIAMRSYVEANIEGASYHSETGIWYKFTEEGDEGSFEYNILDTLNSNLIIADTRLNYTGKLLNGTTFDSHQSDTGARMIIVQDLRNSSNNTVISAWIVAFMPKSIGDTKLLGLTEQGLQKNAKVRIVAPSGYCYGNIATGKIPANSPLDFTIELINIQKYSPTVNRNL